MHKAVFIAILVFLAAIFFRFWMLDSVPSGLYPDEAMNGNNALFALESGNFKVFYPENNGREGLFMNIAAFSINLFGNEPWVIRLISAIFGSLTILGMFYFGRELFRGFQEDKKLAGLSANEIIALFASFFAALSFWHINFSRIGFRAIMAPFFLVWSLYLLWLIFRRDLSERKKIVASTLGGILFGLGAHSYIAYRLAPVLLLLPLFFIIKNKIGYKYIFLFTLLALAAFMPLGFYYLENPSDFLGRTSQISVFSESNPLRSFSINLAKTYASFWFLGDLNPRHNFPGRALLWWPIGILFALGLIFSLIKNRKNFSTKFLWFWLFIFALPAAFSSDGLPHALRSLLLFPAVMYFSAIGLWEIVWQVAGWLETKSARLKLECVILLSAFLSAHIIITYSDYFWRWANLPETREAFSENYVDIGRWLSEQKAELKKYVLVNAEGVLVASPDDSQASFMPMPAQTVMFMTNTWAQSERLKKNIYYLLPKELDKLDCSTACVIVPLHSGPDINTAIKKAVGSEVQLTIKPGFAVFYQGLKL